MSSMIMGIDEVGRGCWAGPVVAGAVILSSPIPGLKDSKLLTKKRREELAAIIEREAIAYGLGWVTAADVDKLGITTAVKRAMEIAAAAITVEYDEIIIDGSFNFLAHNPKARTVVKADMTIPAASAASIIAKVARDNYMTEMARQYPEYGFAHHVGYGTALHVQALEIFGITPLHRRSYKPIQRYIS